VPYACSTEGIRRKFRHIRQHALTVFTGKLRTLADNFTHASNPEKGKENPQILMFAASELTLCLLCFQTLFDPLMQND
jgi:hypothetical protein